MKTFTRILRAEYANDFNRCKQRNNSKDSERTAEQIAQSEKDKKEHYLKKWENFRQQAETKAQKEICDFMIRRING